MQRTRCTTITSVATTRITRIPCIRSTCRTILLTILLTILMVLLFPLLLITSGALILMVIFMVTLTVRLPLDRPSDLLMGPHLVPLVIHQVPVPLVIHQAPAPLVIHQAPVPLDTLTVLLRSAHPLVLLEHTLTLTRMTSRTPHLLRILRLLLLLLLLLLHLERHLLVRHLLILFHPTIVQRLHLLHRTCLRVTGVGGLVTGLVTAVVMVTAMAMGPTVDPTMADLTLADPTPITVDPTIVLVPDIVLVTMVAVVVALITPMAMPIPTPTPTRTRTRTVIPPPLRRWWMPRCNRPTCHTL